MRRTDYSLGADHSPFLFPLLCGRLSGGPEHVVGRNGTSEKSGYIAASAAGR